MSPIKKHFVSICFTLFFTAGCIAQDWKWDTLLNYKSNVRVLKDPFKKLYTYYRGDSVLAKHTPTGQQIWKKTFPYNFHISSAVCSIDSSIYLTGTFQKTLTLGNFSVASKGADDIFVARLNNNGNLIWLKSIGSKSSDDVGDICMNGTDFALTGSVSDTAILSGQIFPRPKKQTLFVAKYYNNGLLDDVLFGNPANNLSPYYLDISSGFEIERDSNGDFVLVIGLLGGTQLDTALLIGGGYDWDALGAFIIKLTNGLKFKWMSGSQYNPDGLYSLRINSQDEIFYVRYTSWKYVSNCSIEKLYPNGASAPFSIKNYPSLFSMNSNSGVYNIWDEICIDSCDNVYFTGQCTRWNYSGNPPPKYFFETAQISPAGSLNWIDRDSSNSRRFGRSIIELAPNNLVVGGEHYNFSAKKYTIFLAGLQTTVGIPGNATPLGNQMICLGKTATLIAQSLGNILWFQNTNSSSPLQFGSTFTASPLSAGIYTYFAEASTCTATTGRAPFTFTVMQTPQLSVNSGTICEKVSFTINPTGAASYTFWGGTAVVSPSVTNAYTITGVASNNCTATAISYITVNPLPNLIVSAGQNYSCVGETVTLTCSGAASYTWNTGSNSTYTVISPVVPVSFTVEGTSAEGCYSKVTHLHKVAPCLGTEDWQQSDLQIFPNPGNGVFTFISATAGELVIYSSSGQTLTRQTINQGENKLNISTLPAGVYHCHYCDNRGFVGSKRVVLQ